MSPRFPVSSVGSILLPSRPCIHATLLFTDVMAFPATITPGKDGCWYEGSYYRYGNWFRSSDGCNDWSVYPANFPGVLCVSERFYAVGVLRMTWLAQP